MNANRILACALAALAVHAADAEQYRLKLPSTVDVIENGSAIGQKRLKAGTILESVSADSDAQTPTVGAKSKLTPSNISPIMWKNKRPSKAVLRADLELSNYYNYSFDGKSKTHWSVDITAMNADWSFGTTLFGYAQKSSPVGKRLEKFLADGKKHRAHIQIKPSNLEGEADICLIEDFEPITAE